MKTVILTTAAMIGALVLPSLAFAVTKSSASAMSFPEYVASVGCVLVDKGGYSNVEAPGGGFCDGMQGHLVAGTNLLTIDPDGAPGTGDEYDRRIGDR